MPWLKGGDNAATHPLVMALAMVSAADDRTTNEVFGFVVRCALQSAGHMTDYRIDFGTADMFGRNRTKTLLKQAVSCGLITEHGSGRAKFWRLVDDPEFLHIRLREEVEWDRQRRKDSANPELTVPVRVRDGDSCRYCGQVVYWRNKKGARGATYDHREPGKPATVDTYVVSCRGCNSKRSDTVDADEQVPLLPAPDAPYYSSSTIKWLAGHGVKIDEPPPVGPASPAGAEQCDTGRRTGIPHRPPAATAPGAVKHDARPDDEADTARPAQPARPGAAALDTACSIARPDVSASDTACTTPSERPADSPSPDTASPTWGHGPPAAPPAWAAPDPPDLQIPADPSRSTGCGPGRDGTVRVGPGAALPSGRSGDLPRIPSGEQSSSVRRRGRRARR